MPQSQSLPVPTPAPRAGRKLALLFFGVTVALLAVFLILDALGVEAMLNPAVWLRNAGPFAALASFLVLLLDVVLPVPSSLVMVANGAWFGFWGGAGVSIAGAWGGSLLAYGLGHGLRGPLGRGVSPDEAARSEQMLTRWGALAVAVSRPLPLLAEAVAIVAGARGFPLPAFTVGSLLGSIPVAVVYAAIGSQSARGMPWGWLVALYAAVALAAYWVGRAGSRAPRPTPTP